MIAALTGTPGVGKTSVARALAGEGFEVLELGALVERKGLHSGVDAARGALEVDPRVLSEFLQPALREARQRRSDLVLEGHLSHLVKGVEVAVVLRCRPSALAARLRQRGWPEPKVRENCQAEALDALTIEAAEERARVLEVDTTDASAEQTAAVVARLLRQQRAEEWTAHRAGSIAWGDEVLQWS
ncbi:MAG TPA: adenylate kinase family protein [Candidatus Thermoplasmatota archaeon]|jgi:adenylate kinase|nr:adenylate kinase family protein [Candidatus Thermoplasmatota archaeon]